MADIPTESEDLPKEPKIEKEEEQPLNKNEEEKEEPQISVTDELVQTEIVKVTVVRLIFNNKKTDDFVCIFRKVECQLKI
jgi:hypothetical protein